MDSTGNVKIEIIKMREQIDYTAISHVCAGGLGNFQDNCLPHCQLQAIHEDGCNTMALAYDNYYKNQRLIHPPKRYYDILMRPREPHDKGWFSFQSITTTCYYWLDTLCIPIHHIQEKHRAINSMGRVYGGAANTLVLDPALSRIRYNELGNEWESTF
ncbi:uncharacterized protein LY89DRAFT_124885 [Mollisia scopiformis]|uniref:Heterokaryon incompatibility domain-containing protein n=1 Tax=Mollisia scopiformis TaxID=149040 RepID=A0A194X407_MOLSC|nr:uncharacterized protein LY89DRAFT_124885 [Mollisia scopiformis]KUJ14918.1 hypothetical protein LY89DRAFT_124885 [Mollisia scopiformis]